MSAATIGGATAVAAFVGGAAAGSAAGAAVTRWPRGHTLVRPRRSECDGCGGMLAIRDLVPVLSWLRLRGRCRTCGSPIGGRTLLIELGGAVGVTIVIVAHGATLQAALLAFGIVAVLIAAMIDLEHRIVPDRLTRPLALVAVFGLPLVAGSAAEVARGLGWALGVPALMWLVDLLADAARRPRPIGAGDVKLLVGVLTLVAPWPGAPAALVLGAFVFGGVVASIGLVTGRLRRRSRMPFAPAIAAAYAILAFSPGLAGALAPWAEVVA